MELEGARTWKALQTNVSRLALATHFYLSSSPEKSANTSPLPPLLLFFRNSY